jgi:hypothetical protein
MSISDKFLNWFIDTDLFFIAYRRRGAKDAIVEKSEHIFDRLLELFLFDSSKKELIASANDCFYYLETLQNRTKIARPSQEDMYEWIINNPNQVYNEEYINKRITEWGIQNHDIKFRNIDTAIILYKIHNLIRLASADVARYRFVTVEDYL